MDLLNTNTMTLMERSMGFLWTKQTALLDNISNVETPNYKAKVVTFEESLQAKLAAALDSAHPKQAVRTALNKAEVTVTEAQESARADDNGVNLTEQSVELMRNAYQLQYVMKGINSDISVLRAAIQG